MMPRLQVSCTHFCFNIISFDLNTNFSYSKVSLQTLSGRLGWKTVAASMLPRAAHISPVAVGRDPGLFSFRCACAFLPRNKAYVHMTFAYECSGFTCRSKLSRPCVMHLCSGKLQQHQNDPCDSVGGFPGMCQGKGTDHTAVIGNRE